MKKIIIIFASVMITATFVSCGGTEKKAETPATEQSADVYTCPMKCSEQKSDKPGKCEVCGMDLEKSTES